MGSETADAFLRQFRLESAMRQKNIACARNVGVNMTATMNPWRHWLVAVSSLFSFGARGSVAYGQAEVNVWGGLRGIRFEGELMVVTTGLRAVAPGAATVGPVRQERLSNPRFSRQGQKRILSGGLVSSPVATSGGNAGRRNSAANQVSGEITYEDAGPGVVNVEVHVAASAVTPLAGIYYFIHLPAEDYSDGSAQLLDAVKDTTTHFPRGAAKGVRVTSPHRQFEVTFSSATDLVVQEGRGRDGNAGLDIYFPINPGGLTAGQTASLSFTLKATGEVDKSPVTLTIDPAQPGSSFAGIGGNFRLQSPLDPPQVAYNLANLRVAWSRVNVPLDRWQPQEDRDPVALAKAGQLNDNVRQALEMERTLAQKNIPIVMTIWSLPVWARTPFSPRPADSGGPGVGSTYRLNPDKWDAVCKSIGAYLDYAKENYGVEPKLFSFNETDIGYDVLQTPQEHAEEIKRLGGFFAARGLATKVVLGDTGDPTGINFINAAMADPEAVKFIGAVSYHSWRGGTAEQFTRWGAAARKLGVPLLIGEGGMDSDAYRYQALLLEPWYAMVEIAEYIDICRYSQPLSILQWQLTADYSLLTGGRDGQPLAPAQRFWQLKQLGMTPAGSPALPVTCDKSVVIPCAFGDAVHGYTVHVINPGPTRIATVSGFPANVRELRLYVTDAQRGMSELQRVAVAGGVARFTLEAMSHTTLMGGP